MAPDRPSLLVLASTYPRWQGDHEPGFVHELSRRLQNDFRVTVLCPHSRGAKSRENLDGVDVVRYRYAPEGFEVLVNDGGIMGNLKRNWLTWALLPCFFLAQMCALFRVLREVNPDVIHAHWIIPQGLSAVLVCSLLRLKSPIIVTSHGADFFALKGRLFRYLKRFVVRNVHHLTVVSSVMAERAVDLGISKKNISVKPMGVDLESLFTPNLEVQRRPDEILFVGRLVEKKGLTYLLEAMPEVIEQRPNARLTVIGFGPEEETLKHKAHSLDLGASVRFLGAVAQQDLPAYYRRSAVFVAPFIEAESGDQEGLGLVSVEALSCGCPVILSDLPACADVSEVVNSVVSVPQKNSRALAQAMVRVLSENEKLVSATLEARSNLRRRFGWGHVANAYSAILINAVSGNRT